MLTVVAVTSPVVVTAWVAHPVIPSAIVSKSIAGKHLAVVILNTPLMHQAQLAYGAQEVVVKAPLGRIQRVVLAVLEAEGANLAR